MKSNSKGYSSRSAHSVLHLRSLDSLHTYPVHFLPIDGDRILFFACPQERTEQEEADRKKAEAAKRQKQVDE